MKERRWWNATPQTDPGETVVPIRRQTFESLAGIRQRAIEERHEILTERQRLESAYAAEMARMDDLLRRADERLKAAEDQIRGMLAEIGISAKFVADVGEEPTP